MPTTYSPIATTTLGSNAADVTFSSISGSYTDLILICSVQSTGVEDLAIRVNSDTAANYSRTTLSGTGSSAVSNRVSSTFQMFVDRYALPPTSGSSFAAYQVHFMNYSNTTTYKTVLSRSAEASGGTDAIVNLWRSTSAITTIKIFMATTYNLKSGSTFTLYGVKAA